MYRNLFRTNYFRQKRYYTTHSVTAIERRIQLLWYSINTEAKILKICLCDVSIAVILNLSLELAIGKMLKQEI